MGEGVGVGDGGGGLGGPESPDTPLCRTVTARPAMVNVPSRDSALFGAIVRVTVVVASPAERERSIQGALPTAVHAQPASVETPTERLPPPAPIERSVGLTAKVHGAAAWLSGRRVESTVSDAVRADGTVFSETV